MSRLLRADPQSHDFPGRVDCVMLDNVSTTVKTSCERCGAVDVPLTELVVDVPVRPGEETVVGFTCPGCSQERRQALSERATMLLLHAGVQIAAASPDDVPDLNDSESRTDRRR